MVILVNFREFVSETFLNKAFILFNNKMAKRIGGSKRKTRYKLQKEIRRKGKISITKYLQKFNLGDKVYLTAEPAVQKGMYHPRFIGKTGTINKKSGKCYEVVINEGRKEKQLIIHPVHLKRFKNG